MIIFRSLGIQSVFQVMDLCSLLLLLVDLLSLLLCESVSDGCFVLSFFNVIVIMVYRKMIMMFPSLLLV